MFANSRYLISKLGHIMLMSFNMFNFGTRVACSAQSQIFVRFCCWKPILASSKKSQSLNPPLPNLKNIFSPNIVFSDLLWYVHLPIRAINNVPLYDWPELPDVGGFMVSSSVSERGEALWESLYLSTKGCCMWLGNIPAGVIRYLSVSSHLDCNGPLRRIYQFLTKLVIKSLI